MTELAASTPPDFHHWHLSYKYLHPWLEIAMKRLSAESRLRVREEVEGHFNESVDAGVETGLTPEDAAQEAIWNLGSPRRAGPAASFGVST